MISICISLRLRCLNALPCRTTSDRNSVLLGVKTRTSYCQITSSLFVFAVICFDRSEQLPALLTVESSIYRNLAWRSSGENASLFRAFPLYSFNDAPSPLTDVRSPCQFSWVRFTVNHHDSLQLVSSLFNHIQ